ncbi:hypothetical protein FGO68_gene16644 [Halteria grandinella]|uniref:TLDc domain-containing protein n=1 Tax=Halteria grandinella TaxID=5974 RepID=A0A8J8NR40_HALGN|nr:hypothetical protein FGO68_gene16644 [Halteria grandinella]
MLPEGIEQDSIECKMEQAIGQSDAQVSSYKLGKIRNKYLIIEIVCWSDYLENFIPKFARSSKAFKRLYNEQGMSFMRNGQSDWEYQAIPREPDSLIKTLQDIKIIRKGLQGKRFKLEKLYDIKTDGDHPNQFHGKCDGIPHTLCVMQTDRNFIFGGYTKVAWQSTDLNTYNTDETAFLFSLTKQSVHPIQPEYIHMAVYHQKYSLLGTTYTLPKGIEKDSDEAKTYLAGTNTFKLINLQTYRVVFN